MSTFAIEGWITEVARAAACPVSPISLPSPPSPGSRCSRSRKPCRLPFTHPDYGPRSKGQRIERQRDPTPSAARARPASTVRRQPLGPASPNSILPAMSGPDESLLRKSPRRKPGYEVPQLPPAASTPLPTTTDRRRHKGDLAGDGALGLVDNRQDEAMGEGGGEGEATPRSKASMPLWMRSRKGTTAQVSVSSGSPTRTARGAPSRGTGRTSAAVDLPPPLPPSWAGRLASDPSPFVPRQDLPPSASGGSSSAASFPPSPSSKRSRSPAKTAADLRFANVEMRAFHDTNHALPADPDIRSLLDDILATAAGFNVLPRAVRHQVAAVASFVDRVWDQNVTDTYHLADDAALRELEQVQDLVAAAADCQVECQSEVVWNARVHDRLLQLALPGDLVRPWISPHFAFPPTSPILGGKGAQSLTLPLYIYLHSSTATIIPSLVPRNIITGDFLSSRLVDFCIAVEPDATHTQSIKRLLSSEPEPLRSLNQTMYQPLRFRPIAVAVETKLETAIETGANQLAIWTKAWLNRLKAFAPIRPTPPLPMLRVVGHSWFLLLAWEEFDEDEEQLRREPTLVIAGDILLGDTRSVVGAYKVLGAIRRLGIWAEGPFRRWYEEDVVEAECRRRNGQSRTIAQ